MDFRLLNFVQEAPIQFRLERVQRSEKLPDRHADFSLGGRRLNRDKLNYFAQTRANIAR